MAWASLIRRAAALAVVGFFVVERADIVFRTSHL
jgi:hypothetical protein